MKNSRCIGSPRRIFRGFLLSGLVALGFAACVTPLSPEQAAEDRAAKQFATDPESATIYFYRGSHSFGFSSMFVGMAGLSVLLYFDGQKISALRLKEFLRMTVPPGPHDIVVVNARSRRQARISLDVEKGKLYFLEVIQFVKIPANLNPPAVTVVDEKTGRKAVLNGTVVIVEKGPRVLR